MVTALIVLFAMLLFLSLLVGGTIFWVMMFVDIVRRKDWRDDIENSIWIVLMLVLGLPAAIAYYFALCKPRGRAKKLKA